MIAPWDRGERAVPAGGYGPGVQNTSMVLLSSAPYPMTASQAARHVVSDTSSRWAAGTL